MALKVGELYASFGIDASELDKALSGIEQKCSNLASSMTKTGAVMSAAITAPLVKVGKEIYEAGTSFYSQMSRVEAISGANATQMEALTAKAIEMGSTTSFTATEAGKALEYMAMAGWKSDEMLAGLAPIMDLAAASGEELAATSDIVTDALTAFGLTANDAAMFSDVLAAAATNSNTNVGMMGETFKYVAPVAGALGYTIQDTAVAIGLMANSGIKGSQAGTALRNVLTNMAKPTDTVQAAMDKLGVSLTDASGSVIPLNQVLTTLRGSFSQLSEAEKTQYATMLAGKYGMSGLLAIVNATDEEFQSLTDSINDAEGATSRMAATILDNAQGDVTIFKSAVEGLEITLWGLVDGPFRSIVQTATKWVDSFREMDSATQVAVLKVGALAAAIGPALIMGGRVVKIVGKLIPLMHALASPVGIITGALALFAVAAVDANNDIGKSFVRMSKKVGGSLKKVNAEIQGKMQTVSKRMPALCASIVEGVQNIVPEFMDTALLAVTGMMDTISDNASNIAEIGKTIITSILGGISKNLPSLISSGTKMMTSIASALIRNIPTLVQSVAQIAAAIWNGLKNTNWVALGKEILAAIGDALSGLVDLFKGWFEQAKEAVKGVKWSDVWESIKSGFNIASDWLKNLILGDAATDSSTWGDVGAKIWGWIKTGIKVSGDWLKGLVLGDAYTPDASWTTVGKTLWGKVKEGFKTTGDWIKSLVLGNAFTADSTWTDVGEKIVGKISEGLSKLDFSGETLSAKLGNVSQFVQGLVKKILEAKAEHKEAITAFVTNLISSIASFDGWTTLADTFSTIAGAIISGVTDAIPKVANAAVNIIGAIGTLLSGESAKNLLAGMTTIATTIINGIASAIPTLTSMAGSIVTAIGSLLAGIDWANAVDCATTIGKALLDAIVVGIKGLGNLAVNIVEALGTVLAGINWGDLTVSLDGFASMLVNGIVEGIKALYSAGTDIVQAVGDVLSKVDWTQLGKAAQAIGGTLINGIVEGLKAMTTGAADIFSAIADMFGKISWSEIGDVAGDIAKSLIDGLVSGLGDLSESGGISDLIAALGDAIVSAASGLATAASTLVGELVTYLLDPANLLKLGEVGLQFVGEIVKGVLNLGTNMIYGAADVLTNTIVGFFRGIFGIKVDPYVEQMMNQFYDLEFDVPTDLFDGYGKACGAALMMAMEGAFSNTKQLEEAVYSWGVVVESGYAQFVPQFEYLGNESVVSLYRGFLNGMETGSATAEQSAREAALLIGLGYGENLENALEAHYPAVSDALAGMFEDNNYIDLKQLASEFGFEIGDLMGFSIPEGYALAIVDGTPTIISKSQELLAAGEAAIAEGWNADELMAGLWDYTFQTTFAEIDKWKPELTQILEDMGVEAGSLLGVALPDGVAEGLKNGTMSVEQAAAAIAAAAVVTQADVNKSIADNTSRGEETGEAVATGEDNAKGTVGDASTGLHDTVTGAFVPLPQELTDTTNEAMAGMETSILDGQAPNEAAALEVSDAVVKKFILNMSETNGKEIGTKFVNAIKSAVTSCKSSLASEADNAARAAVSAASSVLTNGAGSSIGYNFAQGIANGIRAGSSVIRAAARSAAQSALSAAKSSLGIHSPSTVAEREIGWMWDAGLAKGVLGKVQLIEKAAGDVTDSLHDSFLVGDPSRGTVYTSGDTIRQTAKQTAEASNEKQSLYEKAEAIGRVIADRLIESGALDGDVIMDGDKVGEKVSNPVSKTISKKSRQTVAGRSAQGVIA